LELIMETSMDQQQQADINLIKVEDEQNSHVLTSLSSHISSAWVVNRDAKRDVEDEMIEALRTVRGQYGPETLAKIIKFGGSDQFIRITAIKCKAIIGWLRDIFLSPGERPFGIDPTPVSDIKPEDEEQIVKKMATEYNRLLMDLGGVKTPEMDEALEEYAEMMKGEKISEIQKQAREDANDNEVLVADILKEAKFDKELSKAIVDIIQLKAGIMEGPMVEIQPTLEWQEDQEGKSRPVVTDKAVRKYYRRSPFDVYPAPGALTPDEGDLIIKNRFTRSQLLKFKGVKGFNEDAINLVLDRFGDSGYMDWLTIDSEIADTAMDDKRSENNMGTIDCLKYFGSVQGKKLLEWGMSEKEVPDPYMEYEIIAYLISSIVISAKINPHPLKKRGVYKACYSNSNESFWGDSVPDVLKDIQKMGNACVRAWVANMGIASGPQQWVNTDAFPNGQDETSVYPMKVWKFTTEDLELTNGVPMGWFQPESNSNELLSAYEKIFNQADEISGIPKYMSGSSDVGGAGETATGLSMLMEAATKTMKDVIGSIDQEMIVPIVEETWLSVMMYEPEKASGDIRITARASDYLIQKDTTQARRENFLDRTNNETDMAIIGMEGRAEILRENVKSLKMPVDKIIPRQQDLEKKAEEQKMIGMAETIAESLNVPVEIIVQAAQGISPEKVSS